MSKQRAYASLASSVKNYEWVSFGDASNPTIALIAPSDGEAGESGKERVKTLKNILVARGFCVKMPEYTDGSLVIEKTVEGRKYSAKMNTITPAVSSDVSANQVIDCVGNGWNMLPLRGGDGFEKTVPIIAQHFEANPQDKNPNVKIFGFSNSTYATILASRGICSFISTPFVNIFDPNRSGEFQPSAQVLELEKLLTGEEVETYPRRIIYNPDNKLSSVRKTFNYPMNFGTVVSLTKEENRGLLQIEPSQNWSLSVEGFLQTFGELYAIDYAHFLNKFLSQHREHLPSFIEIGNLVTRLDGRNGYQNLLHDEATGQILVNEENVDKLYAGREKLAVDVKAFLSKKSQLELQISDSDFNSSPQEDQQHAIRQLRLISLIPDELSKKSHYDKDDVINILHSQNLIQAEVMLEIEEVVKHHRVPLIQNTRNGHCANMSIVNGGSNEVRLDGDKILMIMQQRTHGHISPISGESLAASAAILTKEMHQDFIAATQQNYVMGKVTYRRGGKDETPVITIQGEADFHNPGKPMTAKTISGIGSITKQFTAATLLKLWDEEITEDETVNFPDGIDTKLSHFMPSLKEKFPECDGIFAQFERDENYAKVTLRDLLNHTHGLGARDGRAIMNHMHTSAIDRPLELSEVINFTVKTENDIYGEHKYGNLGCDLTAMIIEAIVNNIEGVTYKKFDDIVKEKVLDPNELFDTHPQSDHLGLYASLETDISRGFVFNQHNTEVEANFNTRSNTRAAGGFKSTVEDLAKFATLFMGAEMFENENVKRAIIENDKGVVMGGNALPSMKDDRMYHLAMTTNINGTIGHPGNDFAFLANLRFNPQTQETTVSLSVIEKLSSDICKKVFEESDPQTLRTIEKFWQEKLLPELVKNNKPEVGSALWHKITEEVLAREVDAEVPNAIRKYSNLRQQVLSIPRENLIKEKESITESLVKSGKPFIEKVEESAQRAATIDSEKSGSEQKKSFAQRMRSDKTQGKSHGGFNEL